MKNCTMSLVTGTSLLLGSLVSLAHAAPNPDLLLTNDDGSVTWQDPRFRFEGQELPFALPQNEDARITGTGICRVAGFERFVMGGTSRGAPGEAVVVDVSGGYRDSVYTSVTFNQVTCASGAHAVSRRHVDLLANDDGSFTIVQPAFRYAGVDSPIGYKSSPDKRSEGTGVCRLYGFERYVADTLADDDFQEDRLPIIGNDGSLAGTSFVAHYYHSITCTN